MERPKTRVGSSMGIRPGSSMRTGTRAGMPPPSSMGRGFGGGMKNVTDRPVTKQGVANPNKIKTGYSNRSVKDAGFYKYNINTKINEIEAKTSEFQQKTEKIYRDLDQYGPMVEKAEKTAKELADLQTQFRSINLTKDLKQRGELNDAAIVADIEMVKDENSRKRREIEEIMQRKEKIEKKTREIQTEIEQHERSREQTLKDALPGDEYNQVMAKQKDLKQLAESIPVAKEKLTTLGQEVENRQKRLKMEQPEKFYAFSLLARIQELAKEKHRLEEKNNKYDQEAEQTRLMDEVKQKKQRIEEMKGRLNFLASDNKNLIERRSMYENDSHFQPDQLEKLHRLNAKQEEMKKFKENFPELKQAETEKIQKFQDENESILQQITSKTELMRNLPSREKFGELQETLNFKQSEMEKAESTHSAVSAQKIQLVNDLQKLNQLKPRIETEIEELNKQILKLNEEQKVYGDILGLKDKESNLKTNLVAERQSLQQRMEWIKKNISYMEKQRDELKAKLGANETFTQLKALEQKWVAEEQRNATMADFIAEKESKIDCQPLIAESKKKIKEINEILISHLKASNATY